MGSGGVVIVMADSQRRGRQDETAASISSRQTIGQGVGARDQNRDSLRGLLTLHNHRQ